MPGIKNLNCFDSAACVQCFFVFCFMRNNIWVFCIKLQAKGVLLCGVCRRNNKAYLIVEYCKKSNFGQKTKRENG